MRMVRYMIGRRDVGNADQVDTKKQMEREDRFYKELDRGRNFFSSFCLVAAAELVRNY